MKEILTEKLKIISFQLTTEDILESRQFRNWEEFDQLSEVEKLRHRLEELEIFQDIIEF